MTKTRIDLALLIPEAPDQHDACAARLEALLGQTKGVERTHVVRENGKSAVCIHFDPSAVTLAQVERVARAAGAKVTDEFGHAILHLRAVDSEDAARRIEAVLRAVPGVLEASFSLPAQVARVEYERQRVTVEQISLALEAAGYQLRSDERDAPRPPGRYRRNKELVWSLIAGLLLLSAWVGTKWFALPRGAAIAFYLAAYVFGGFDLTRHLLGALFKRRFSFDIDLLMLLAAAGAALLGEWAEGAFLLFLFSLAHALEHYALGRARNAIRSLADLAPPMARVISAGSERSVPIDQVRVGDVVLIRPAERIPVDGTVRNGSSSVNQAPITGESVPVEKVEGAQVFAGTINGDGALEVETARAAGDRTLDRVIKLVEEAQTQKAPTQQLTERFERIFVPLVLVADLLLIVLPPLLGVWDWSTSFYRGMAMLVAASPCALALGTPSAVLAGIAQAARKGVLIKGGAHLENLGMIRAIAFDKTGTLTVGKPQVTDLIPAGGVSETELLRIAAAVERRSQHPLAAAIVRHAEAGNLDLPDSGELQSLTARGVRSKVEGKTVEIGSLRLWEADGVSVPPAIRDAVSRVQAAGRSIVVVRHGDRWLGVIGVADQPRHSARAVLGSLRELKLSPLIMLTGDNQGVGEAIGKEVGVDVIKAGLLPEDKVSAIRDLLKEHGPTAMVGDGVNDAPALANATVGIAMGGAGTAAALETADVALMGDDLEKLPFSVALSRKARAIIRQNLALSLAVIAGLILATATGWARIGVAVLFHEGSTLVVIANSLRLLAFDLPSRQTVVLNPSTGVPSNA